MIEPAFFFQKVHLMQWLHLIDFEQIGDIEIPVIK